MADTNKIRMEIIYSKKYERANIRFSEKPSEECRSALKDEGWSYSSKNNVWYPKNEAGVFEEKMKEHVMNDAFIDVAYNQTTITDKYDINPGRNFYNLYHDNSDRNIDVEASWKPEINASLFPPEENVSRTVGDVGEAAKNYNASSNLFTRDFLKQYNFMPPVLLRENEAVVRCNPADLNPRYVRMDVPAGKSVDITIPKQFLMDSIMAGIKTEAERVIKYNDEHPDSPDKLQLAGMCLNEDNLFEQQKQLLKDNGINNPKDMIEAVNSMRQQLFFGENSIFNSIPVKDNSKEKEQEIEEEGFDR